MAEATPTTAPHQPSDADKAKARQWFKKANDTRQKREYDYAIECYVTGLNFWPEAVEEALMPLKSLALQRLQAGGKKPSMMESMKHSMTGKDHKQAMLNGLWLLAKDPTSLNYAEGALKAANRGGYGEVVKMLAPAVFDLLKKDKKPDTARFKALRQALLESAERAEQAGNNGAQIWFLELAVQSLDFLRARMPDEASLRDEQRDLSSRLTIARGKYQEADSFRESVRDADAQKVLHDTERVKQGDQTLEALLASARADLAAHPGLPGKINALVELLLRRERRDEENEAIDILSKAYAASRNYSFKMKADDIRLRQLTRQTRELVERARQTGSDEDRQNARLSAMEQLETELEIYRERVANYPTDLTHKYRLGAALFKAKQYDEAIPVLQVAQGNPRTRVRCQMLIGRSFLEKGAAGQAAAVLREAADSYEITGDDTHKELLYALAQAYELAGDKAEAIAAYGKLLRIDYMYAEGEARRRMEALQ